MMTEHEKLIAEAAEQLLWTTRGDEEPGVDWPGDRDDARRMAEVVLGVFEKAHAPEWEYTYMHPVNGYDDDYAGLPGSLERAKEVAAEWPGKGVILKRPISRPWVPIDQDGA